MTHRATTRVSEPVLAAIINESADAVICTDAIRRITFFNTAAARLFGYAPDEVLGKTLDILLPARERAKEGGGQRRFRQSG